MVDSEVTQYLGGLCFWYNFSFEAYYPLLNIET